MSTYHVFLPMHNYNKIYIQKALVDELGSDWRSLFKEFNNKPFAAASIGQVHSGVTMDDVHVAVKIQVLLNSDYFFMNAFPFVDYYSQYLHAETFLHVMVITQPENISWNLITGQNSFWCVIGFLNEESCLCGLTFSNHN